LEDYLFHLTTSAISCIASNNRAINEEGTGGDVGRMNWRSCGKDELEEMWK
jgi:hypothetical protein